MTDDTVVWHMVGDTLVDHHGIEIEAGESLPIPQTVKCIYLAGEIDWYAVHRRYLQWGDSVVGPRKGSIQGATIRHTAGRQCRLTPVAAWGIDQEAEDAAGELAHIRARWCEWAQTDSAPNTAGGAAMSLLRPALMAAGQWGCLRPRWRPTALAGAHTGAAVCLRAHVPRAVEVDRSAAYLQELARPMPIAQTWRVHPWSKGGRSRWRALQADYERSGGEHWMVCARVEIHPPPPGAIAPLPIRDRFSRTRWGGALAGESIPVGVWDIEWLQRAEDAGFAYVHGVEWVLTAKTRPYFERLSDTLFGMPKDLKKTLYLRVVGMMAYRGWIEGLCTEDEEGEETIEWGEPVEHWDKMPPSYRPDCAGLIWAANSKAMVMEYATTHEEGGVVGAMHVDAVWRTDNERIPDKWQVKARGDFRGYGVGRYDIGKKSGRMGGIEPAAVSKRLLWTLSSDVDAWDGDPSTDLNAVCTLKPLTGEDHCERIVTPGEHNYSPGGWRRHDNDERFVGGAGR